MLEKVVVGWEQIEAPFLANIAIRKPFILLGRHGTCKTTCAKLISEIYGEDGFRFFDATKDDLVSIAGIPIPEKLAKGKLEFAGHERSIWDAKVIVVDELTRANKENQNLWLEILEEKTCFGKPLHYEALIATMNPETYASTFKLDQALLDRFYAVLPVPELQGATAQKFKELLAINFYGRGELTELKQWVNEIKKAYNSLRQSCLGTVIEYTSTLMELLFANIQNTYISPRKCTQLAEEILAIGAYYKAVGKEKYLEKAAKKALMYTLVTPIKIDPATVFKIHESLKSILSEKELSEEEKLRVAYSRTVSLEGKVKFVDENAEKVEKLLSYSEKEKMIAELLRDIEKQKLTHLYPTLKKVLCKMSGLDELKRELSGKILLLINKKARSIYEYLVRERAENDEQVSKLRKAHAVLLNINNLLKKDEARSAILIGDTENSIQELYKMLSEKKPETLNV